MPKLRQAVDGHWYIRASVHAAGRIATYQVSDEGAAYLLRMGYGEGEDIPSALFTELSESNLVFTRGSGFGDQADVDFLPAKGAEKQLKLAISAGEAGWILEVLVPELPAEIFAQVTRRSNQSALTKCSLRIDGDKELLPISRLWPGKGGARWPLDPHEQSYSIAFAGPWPSVSALEFLTHAVDGLQPGGTIFFGPDNLGMRVPRGMGIPVDNSYFLVVGERQSSFVTVPASVGWRALGVNNGWKAWELRIPEQVDESTKRWIARFGAILEEPRASLELVSPPPKAMLVTGLPLLEVGDEVIVAATAPQERLRLEEFGVVILCDGQQLCEIPRLRSADQSAFFRFLASQPGTYQVRALKGRIAPLTFAVRPVSARATTAKMELSPLPLMVAIGEQKYAAFSDGTEERLECWVERSEKKPFVRVECAATIKVKWKVGGTSGLRTLVDSDVTELLTSELARALEGRRTMDVELDAGSFGRLLLQIGPTDRRLREGGRISPMIGRRGRWLTATINAFRNEGDSEVVLSQKCLESLRHLASYPGCEGLARIEKVPSRLIHHANALSRELHTATRSRETITGGVVSS